MLFYYIVVESINGIKMKPTILNDLELQNKIEELTKANGNKHTIITERAGWYRVYYGSKKNYIRYKTIK